MEQDELYPNRGGSGAPFFRHAELQKLGIPIIVGIYGTDPMHWILSPKETRLGSGTANLGLNQLIFIESSNNKVKID